MILRLTFVLALLAGAAAVHGQAAPDAVKAKLDAAQASRTSARAAARAELLKAIDEKVKSAASAGDLETLKAVTPQKDAFVNAGIPPTHASLAGAAAKHDQAMRRADGLLVAAYEVAIEEYSSQQRFGEATQVRAQRRQLLEGQEPAAPGGQLPSAEAVAAALTQAKAAHRLTTSAAKATLLEAIDARVNTATVAGDLKSVTALRAVRAAAEADGPLPADVKDASILGAKERQKLAVQAANQQLARAYEAAIRDYTRIRKIDEALAAQAEMEAARLKPGAGAAPASAGPAATPKALEPIQRLAKILPSQLTASEPYAVAREGGITPKNGTSILTKRTEFLTKDYIFDVWVQIEKRGEAAIVGVGGGRIENSLALLLRPTEDQHHGATLIRGDQWGEGIVDVREPGIYLIRVERHGGAMTFSIGTEKNGVLEFDGSRTVQDPKAFMPKLNEKAAHLFFGGGVLYKQFRLTVLPNAAPAAEVPGAIVPLGRDLSPSLTASESYTVKPTGGIAPRKGTFILTRAADFLDKDKEYVFDVWVSVPADGEWASVGIGDGKTEHSLALSIRPPKDKNHAVALTRGETWGEKVGDMRAPGVYVARIEKRGETMTFSVGSEKNGRFEPDCSKTISDAKAFMPKLSPRSAHLYFGGGQEFLKYRLVMGKAARAAANPPAPEPPPKPAAPPVVVPPPPAPVAVAPPPDPVAAPPAPAVVPPAPVVATKAPVPATPVEFKVTAKAIPANPLTTGIRLGVGDAVTMGPNTEDRWVARRGGKKADYRGVPLGDHMALRWKIGQSSGMVAAGKRVVATEAGELSFYCADASGGDNSGFIRVTVTVTPAAPSGVVAPKAWP